MTSAVSPSWVALVVQIGVVLGVAACSSTGKKDIEQELLVEPGMALDEAIEIALEHGPPNIKPTLRSILANKASDRARKILVAKIRAEGRNWSPEKSMRAAQLYRFIGPTEPEQVFTVWLRSNEPFVRNLAWGLAKDFPGPNIRVEIEKELSRALVLGNEDRLFTPNMARALVVNRMQESYSFAKLGLEKTASVEFVEALGELDPVRASSDLLAFLTRAPTEELRQLNMSTVSPYACLAALRHLSRYPVAAYEEDFPKLFEYALSRNNGLSEIAKSILDNYLPKDAQQLAIWLNQQPIWLQVGYIERLRRDQPRYLRTLLAQLRSVASQPDVVSALDDIIM